MINAVAIVSADDGLISYTNRSWNEVFGYADGEAVGRHMSVAYAPSDNGNSSAVPHEIVTALEHNGHWRGETQTVRKDGRAFRRAISISEFDEERHARMWVMVGRRLPEDSR